MAREKKSTARMQRMVHGAGAAAKKAARASGKVAKFAGATVLPAVPVARGLAKGQINVAEQARTHMAALRARETGAGMKAMGALGRLGMAASTVVLPALAAAAAYSTARDVYRRTGHLDDAVGEGAFSGVDLVLGGAMAEYSRSRAAGESRAAAVTSGVLEGVNNRFLLGYGDEIVKTLQDPSQFAKIWPGAPGWLKNAVSSANAENAATERAAAASAASWQSARATDQTTLAITRHGDAENGRAMATHPRASSTPSGGRRLAADDAARFAFANDSFGNAVRSRSNPKSSAAGAAGTKKKGWANPAVQRAAQKARNVQNISSWAEDEAINGA